MMDEGSDARANYEAAKRVRDRLGAALDRLEQAMVGSDLVEQRAATEAVSGLIAEAQEWVDG